MGNQRILALLIIIIAGFALWLHSQDRFVPFLEALFGGGTRPATTSGTGTSSVPGGIAPAPVGGPGGLGVTPIAQAPTVGTQSAFERAAEVFAAGIEAGGM